MNNKFKYLFKNIGLMTLSNFCSKLLSFFLVPLYTSILTTEEYGAFDFIHTTVFLLVPVFTVDIVDAVIRFSLDKKNDRQGIFTVGVKMLLLSLIAVAAFMGINYAFNLISVINTYIWCFAAYYIAYAFNQLMFYFVRGIDRVNELAVASLINTIITLVLNVLFLTVFKLGFIGYFAACITALTVSAFYVVFRTKAWKYISFKKNHKTLQKEMIKYSSPLILNAVSWWINSASDRYVVSWICGLSANGILSVANKIPSILNIFQAIFNQAWQLSTVKSYDPDDKDGFFTNTYNMYNFALTEVCSVLIVLDIFLSKILYAKDFFEAWRYVPFYLMAILFASLSGFFTGIFKAVKDGKTESLTTTVGAVCNIIINLILVLKFGPIGAAIATAISYIIVWALKIYKVKKYINLKINLKRDVLSYILLIVQIVILLTVKESFILYSVLLSITLIITLLYVPVMKNLFKSAKNIIKSKLNSK